MLLFLLACFPLSCGGRRYQVHASDESTWFAEARHSALDGYGISDTTRDILRRRDLLELLRSDPEAVARQLDRTMRRTRSRNLALAIAEIAHTQTRGAPDPNRNALGTTLRYSYAFLFDPLLEPAPNRYDIRFRWACDLYNRALADFVRNHVGGGGLRDAPLQWVGGSTIAKPGRIEIDYELTEYNSIRVAYDFEIEGLPAPLRFEGLGAPCILTHDSPRVPDTSAMEGIYLTKRSAFAATFFVRFPDGASILDEPSAPATYDIFDPTRTVGIEIAGQSVPLEIDYTTPVVYSIAQQEDQNPGIKALFRGDLWASRGGLYALQPIRKDRIPVILIHGLASDPFTWIPLYNDLMADEQIRTRFQFLVWFYPTGQPVMVSAAKLRQTLLASHSALQEEEPNPALDSMVLCGHSLGGMLAHYLVIDPGTAFQDAELTMPIDQMELPESDKQMLRSIFLYKSLPFVKRVIFYATPHHGAPNAQKGIFDWLAGFIRLPSELTGSRARIRRYMKPGIRSRRLTSRGSLDSATPSVKVLNSTPITARVNYHSIIADSEQAGRKGGSDGFVPYASSHIEGATSEVIIKSGHSVQHNPLAARETRRILLKHLAAFDAAQKKRR